MEPDQVDTSVDNVVPADPVVDNPPDKTGGSGSGADSGVNQLGFPADTPLAEMTGDQQLAYWKHQSRKHENVAKSLKGAVTAEDAKKLTDRIAELEREKLSDDQRAQADAIEAAKAEAAKTAREELLPQLRDAQLRGYASIVLTDQKKLDAWLKQTKAEAFLGDSGDIDGAQVVAHLTEMFGDAKSNPGANGQTHPNWGQGRGAPMTTRRGDSGRAEAARRFGSKEKTE
ncbi:hypothetical protein AB0E01_23060 [Nocardia vinacea]|uniref:hypothetical protein n=1 Tax=Nocardia vinacea TaxID=96468 RepID=UPI0033C21FDB